MTAPFVSVVRSRGSVMWDVWYDRLVTSTPDFGLAMLAAGELVLRQGEQVELVVVDHNGLRDRR